MKRYVALALVLLCVPFLYVQVMVERGFNTVVLAADGYSIRLTPESRQRFGGLSWGLLRFDLQDELYVGVTAHLGANRDAIIRLEKDGNVLDLKCRSDETGTCYEAFHRDDMRMSGVFKLTVLAGERPIQTFSGKFFRQSRPFFLLREALLSV